MSAKIVKLPGTGDVPKGLPKSAKSIMDTVMLDPAGVAKWKAPPFQRQLKMGGKNSKVQLLVEELRENGGVIPGILTLGKLGGDTFLIDGQHRIAAFRESGVAEGIADVRICHFDNMGEMSQEFVQLNSSLVRLQTDDILRAEEANSPALRALRRSCPFVGYGHIRMNKSSPVVGMSLVLRCWFGSAREAPIASSAVGAGGTPGLVKMFDVEQADACSEFLELAYKAWGTEREYVRLWGALNLCLCMWLYRRVVAEKNTGKVTKLTPTQFGKCLLALSASSKYTDWLVGRNMGERDRSPCYTRIKTLFQRRLVADGRPRATFPGASWATGGTLGRMQDLV